MSRAARWLTFGSAASIMFSIAVSQILLGLALAALFFSGDPLRLPRIKLPLALFILGTLLSWAFSPAPLMVGYPQVRKFLVFSELLIVFSTLRDIMVVRWLFLTWAGIGSISAVRGFVQFAAKIHQAHQSGVHGLGRDFYNYYVSERITGFTSHWNTYSAEEMFALIMLGAFLFFAPGARKRSWVWILSAVLMSFAVLLGETRAIWLCTAGAGLYLVWFWKRRLVLLVPVVVVLAFVVSPPAIRERFTSILQPREVDSNRFRIVSWRTGIRMIEKHPLLGLGPEEVNRLVNPHFDDYIPADIPRPLPSGWYGHMHNIYIQYAAERGIPTMLVMMWMLIRILVDFWRGLRALPPGLSDRRFLLQGGIAVVLATMGEGVVEYNLGDTEVLTMFLVVVACGYLALEKDLFASGALPAHE